MTKLSEQTKYVDIIGEVVRSQNGFHYYVHSNVLRGDKVVSLILVLKKHEVSKKGYTLHELERLCVSYEVWILRDHPKNANPRYINKWNIRFPGNEEFGTHGWSYQNRENAERKIQELSQ